MYLLVFNFYDRIQKKYFLYKKKNFIKFKVYYYYIKKYK